MRKSRRQSLPADFMISTNHGPDASPARGLRSRGGLLEEAHPGQAQALAGSLAQIAAHGVLEGGGIDLLAMALRGTLGFRAQAGSLRRGQGVERGRGHVVV